MFNVKYCHVVTPKVTKRIRCNKIVEVAEFIAKLYLHVDS